MHERAVRHPMLADARATYIAALMLLLLCGATSKSLSLMPDPAVFCLVCGATITSVPGTVAVVAYWSLIRCLLSCDRTTTTTAITAK